MKISRRRLADYVKTLPQKACRTCSKIIFLHSTNQIIVKKLPIIIKEMTMATTTTAPQIIDLTGWMKRNNRAARAARFLVQFFDVGPNRETWNFHFWGSAGARFSKVPELVGPKKLFVKLRPAYSVKLLFSYAVKGIKIKITAKFSS